MRGLACSVACGSSHQGLKPCLLPWQVDSAPPELPGWPSCREPAANAGDRRDVGSIPGLGRSPGEGDGILQYSCLGNPVDRGSWPAAVHGVTKSQTRLSNRTHTDTHTDAPGKATPSIFDLSECCRKTSSFNQDLCQENQIKKRKEKKKEPKKKKQTEGLS